MSVDWNRGPLFASATRTGKRDQEVGAEEVLAKLTTALHGQTLQIGGDATTGRGLVLAQVVEG